MNSRNRKECSEIQMKLKFVIVIRVFDYHKSLSYPQLDILRDPKLIRYFPEKGLKWGKEIGRAGFIATIRKFESKFHTVRLI